MEKTNEQSVDGGTLSIFCIDSLTIKDKLTFYALSIDGIQLTYWFDDEEGNTNDRTDRAFDILFDELVSLESV